MRMLSDGVRFTLMGAIQVAVDSATYVALSKLGVATLPSNISGRVAGALLGFWLNGSVTFAHYRQPHLRLRLARYLALWLVLTAISTTALIAIGAHAGLARTWWCKPAIEIVLGAASFLVSRHWVYRH